MGKSLEEASAALWVVRTVKAWGDPTAFWSATLSGKPWEEASAALSVGLSATMLVGLLVALLVECLVAMLVGPLATLLAARSVVMSGEPLAWL